MDKASLLAKFAATREEKLLFAHLLDLAERAATHNRLLSGDFLTEAEGNTAQSLLRAAGFSSFFLFGGFPDAERTCPVFLPDYLTRKEVEASPSLAGLLFLSLSVSKYDEAAASFTHRDLLGALMALGVDRNRVGDIRAEGPLAVAVIRESVADYLTENLKKVGRFPVTVEIREDCGALPEQRFEEGFGTVASLRLDAVVAEVFRLSRSEASEAIRRELVALSGLPLCRPDAPVKEGDRLSLRGKGKVVIGETDGLSKKGRIRFKYKRLK